MKLLGTMHRLDDTHGSVRVEDVYDTDIEDLWEACTDPARLARWIAEGAVKYKEDIVDGLENAPEAFIGLLEGRNFGKLIVKL